MKTTWVKYYIDFFDDPRIIMMEDLPEYHTLIAIWHKIVCFVGKQQSGGAIILKTTNDKYIIPNEETLASILREKHASVRLALATFCELGLMTRTDETYVIAEWSRHINEEKLQVTGKTRKSLTTRMETKKEKVLAYLKDNPHASKSAISRATGIPRTTVIRYLSTTETTMDTPVQNEVSTCPHGHVHPCPPDTLVDTQMDTPKPLVRANETPVSISKEKEEEKDNLFSLSLGLEAHAKQKNTNCQRQPLIAAGNTKKSVSSQKPPLESRTGENGTRLPAYAQTAVRIEPRASERHVRSVHEVMERYQCSLADAQLIIQEGLD